MTANQKNPDDAKKDRFEKWLDKYFEVPFFMFRYFTMVPVLFSFVGALVMFYIGAKKTIKAITGILHDSHSATLGMDSQVLLIHAVDAFLMGLVLMIFSFGIYELFVSKLDPAARRGVRPNWMKFKDLGGLKTALAEVVLIILVITFFQIVIQNLDILIKEAWSFLVIPIGIIFIAVGIGFFERFTREE